MEVLLAAHKLFHVIAPELDDMVVYLGCQVLTAFQGSDFEGATGRESLNTKLLAMIAVLLCQISK